MISSSPLAKDTGAVLQRAPTHGVRLSFTLQTQNTRFNVERIESLDEVADYVNNVHNKYVVKFSITPSEYSRYLLEEREVMEATIVFSYGTERYVRKYRAYIPKDNEYSLGTHQSVEGVTSKNSQKLMIVSLELVDIEAVPLKLVKVEGGAYNDTGLAVLKSLIIRSADKISVHGDRAYDFLEIEDPNVEERGHVVIPTGTYLTALPNYINKTLGMYSSGIGFYCKRVIRNNRDDMGLFVYSLFNPYRYRENSRKLKIIIEPNEILVNASENTFIEGEKLSTIVTSPITSEGSKGSSSDFDEYGYIGAEPIKGLKDRPKTDGSTLSYKGNNNTAFTFKNKKGGENAPLISSLNKHTTAAEAMTEIASNVGERIAVKWPNSNPEMLRPDLAVSVLMVRNGRPITRPANLLFHHTVYQNNAKDDRYITTTILLLQVSNDYLE